MVFFSLKSDSLIMRMLGCDNNRCNSPANFKSLDKVILCDEGFYSNEGIVTNKSSKLNKFTSVYMFFLSLIFSSIIFF